MLPRCTGGIIHFGPQLSQRLHVLPTKLSEEPWAEEPWASACWHPATPAISHLRLRRYTSRKSEGPPKVHQARRLCKRCLQSETSSAAAAAVEPAVVSKQSRRRPLSRRATSLTRRRRRRNCKRRPQTEQNS